MIRKLLKWVFAKAGYEIRNASKDQAFTMNAALYRCVKRGLQVNTVIDIGASDGRWTRDCMEYIPDARYLLIEAQEPHRNSLEKLKAEKSNADYALAAAGNKEGTIYFDNSGLFGGVASETPFPENCIEVPVITVDSEVSRRKLSPPYLIKLDTHGFEVPILEGCRKTLEMAELVVIEAYNYQLMENSLKYYELCNYMKDLGFSTIEMVDPILRDHDHSLWQMDIFFIPTSNKSFQWNAF